ncbi:hypothetical protein BZA77DRAFT_66710 [Pyronema omphalodes]|nr:hypothetical protein BZA77DRAFT_66710 [Pyronema omphalodes]
MAVSSLIRRRSAVVIGILVFSLLFFSPISFFFCRVCFAAKGYHALLFHWVRLTLVVQSDLLSGWFFLTFFFTVEFVIFQLIVLVLLSCLYIVMLCYVARIMNPIALKLSCTL